MKRKAFFSAGLLSLLILLVGIALVNDNQRIHLQQGKSAIRSDLAQKSSALTNLIRDRLALVYGVRAYVLTHLDALNAKEKSSEEGIQRFLAEIHASYPDIRIVQVAPEGIHRFVHPLNEVSRKSLGHNLLTDKRDAVRNKVLETIASREIGLSGPYPLRQDGSLAMIARLPIFNQDQFWGLATAVLNVPQTLAKAGIKENSPYALRNTGGKSFWGNAELFDGKHLLEKIDLPDGSWELTTDRQAEGLSPLEMGSSLLLTLFIALLVGWQLYQLLTARQTLQTAVNLATTELQEKIGELTVAKDKVRHLEGILPICAYCKKIRDDQEAWHQLEDYITDNSEAWFSHGICPDCAETVRQQMKKRAGKLPPTSQNPD